MFYTARHQGLLEDIEDQEKYNEVLATEIPKKFHKSPEVIEAKAAVMANFTRRFEVQDLGQQRISSRWVVMEKQNHDGMKVEMKARLVVIGFQETEDLMSYSPTLSHDSLRIMMIITSNKDFEIRSLDVKNAYLQGSKIGRTMFVEPSSDYKKEGKIWILKKNVYGTNDSARSFYLSMDETLKILGGKQVTDDDTFYTFQTKKENSLAWSVYA